MLQALIKKGKVLLREVPAPVVSRGGILIKVVNSCISAGTEVSAVQSSGRSLVRRALDQPEKVKRLLGIARTEGVRQAVAKLRGKLEEEIPTGYSLSGIVLAVGEGISDVRPGDRVAAAGAGIANHAEYVDVPRNLVMRIPEGLDFAPASTVTLGGIAMQALRRAQVQLGEFAVVFGVGILGQLVAQMLLASGARVIAVDIEQKRLDLCQSLGAELCLNSREVDAIKSISHYTHGHGADVVLFCAATGDSKALSDAFAMCRKKGRVVMVGVWGHELRREDIYSKELDFLIATSYGPGRYDENYERRGLDYPYAYVRWTENRNMEEYLRLLAKGKISVEPLIDHRYPIKEVEQAFAVVQSPERPLMVLLDYGRELPENYSTLVRRDYKAGDRIAYRPVKADRVRVGVIGAGNFAVATHLPNLESLKDKYEIRAICNRTGSKADALAKRFGAHYATTDYRVILEDPDIDLTMICTRHNLHGRMALESLKAGKHTFVEKPLCIELAELNAIKVFYGLQDVPASNPVNSSTKPLFMVGFNRRFSEYAREVKRHAQNRVNPLLIHYRMNAGYVPLDHWIHSEEGGGRIIGEACHIIDLFSYLVEAPVKTANSISLSPRTASLSSSDNKAISIEYEDGSLATLNYFAIGSTDLPKEHLEVHFDEKTLILDNYTSLTGHGIRVETAERRIPEKGFANELKELVECLLAKESTWPISLESLIETSELCIKLA